VCFKLRLSLCLRFALAFAVVGAVVATVVGRLSYCAASDRIMAEIDSTLRSATVAAASDRDRALPGSGTPAPTLDLYPGTDQPGPGDEGVRTVISRAVGQDGTATHLSGPTVRLPVSDSLRALAVSGTTGQTDITEVKLGVRTYRLLSTSLGDGRGALQAAVHIDQTHRVLGGMAREIAGASLAVTLAAVGVGWALARRLERLARVAEKISVDGRADGVILADGRDEVGRLSASFSRMLDRLAAAREAQDRLVQDAAHELRTPLTSLRTNASVLRRVTELSPYARDRLLDDVEGETAELGQLVDELVELAMARNREESEEPVELSALARRAAQRVHRRTGRFVLLDVDESIVRGRRHGLERAVGNLLENAAKFDPDGDDPIEVHVRQGRITVRDHGPGIDAADAERVFDRFYRADTARSLPGSGLGLAIVRDVAEAHGGTVFARTRPGGGAEVGFTLERARIRGPETPGAKLRGT
jgi:two-component system sensor histidine kinase MprB